MSLDIFLGEIMKQPNIALITACGAKKHSQPMEAYKLYRSPRIKAVYNRRDNTDMYILSAKYGLVGAHEAIEPYNRIMDDERAKELVPSVAEKIEIYDYIIFFKGGARKSYLNCMKEASNKARKTLITLGFANMGGINDLPQIIDFANRKKWSKILEIEHTEIYYPRKPFVFL